MIYYNETKQEYLLRMTKQYARDLSHIQKQMGVFKSDKEIWIISEKEVLERYKRDIL